MISVIGWRLLAAIPVLLGVATLVFVILYLIPGDPVAIMLEGAPTSPEIQAQLREQLGLDRPLAVQYLVFLADLLRFDLGQSITTGEPVTAMVLDQLPFTLALTGAASAIALPIGLFAGVWGAVRRDTWIDNGLRNVELVGLAMPQFWIGILLIVVFSLQLGWVPATGSGGWQRLVLPSVTLALPAIAMVARLTRDGLVAAMSEQYVMTARSKGLAENVVVFKHALRNALLPAITIAGVVIGNMLAGAVVIETVFSRPGIGRMTVRAINQQNIPVVQGGVLVAAIGYVFVNLVVDVLYSVVDPRVRKRASA